MMHEANARDDIGAVESKAYVGKNLVVVLAAGFEDRVIAFLEKARQDSLRLKKAIVLNYRNRDLNEPMQSMVLRLAKELSDEVLSIDTENMAALRNLLHDQTADKFLVDITGMNRVVMFQVLYLMDSVSCDYDIIYTEAEEYFPLKSSFDNLIENTSGKEEAFSRYLENERSEFVYSYDCDVLQPEFFRGLIEPARPAMLLTFFTFKRARLQAILQVLELEKKVLVLGEPVRPELKWRKEYMEIANFDLIQKNEPDVEVLNTLNPFDVRRYFEDRVYRSRDYARYNVILAPLGSKMQTVGSYLFWKKHPEISVMFSQPRSYFRDAYSRSYKKTFVVSSDMIAYELDRKQECHYK